MHPGHGPTAERLPTTGDPPRPGSRGLKRMILIIQRPLNGKDVSSLLGNPGRQTETNQAKAHNSQRPKQPTALSWAPFQAHGRRPVRWRTPRSKWLFASRTRPPQMRRTNAQRQGRGLLFSLRACADQARAEGQLEGEFVGVPGDAGITEGVCPRRWFGTNAQENDGDLQNVAGQQPINQ